MASGPSPAARLRRRRTASCFCASYLPWPRRCFSSPCRTHLGPDGANRRQRARSCKLGTALTPWRTRPPPNPALPQRPGGRRVIVKLRDAPSWSRYPVPSVRYRQPAPQSHLYGWASAGRVRTGRPIAVGQVPGVAGGQILLQPARATRASHRPWVGRPRLAHLKDLGGAVGQASAGMVSRRV